MRRNLCRLLALGAILFAAAATPKEAAAAEPPGPAFHDGGAADTDMGAGVSDLTLRLRYFDDSENGDAVRPAPFWQRVPAELFVGVLSWGLAAAIHWYLDQYDQIADGWGLVVVLGLGLLITPAAVAGVASGMGGRGNIYGSAIGSALGALTGLIWGLSIRDGFALQPFGFTPFYALVAGNVLGAVVGYEITHVFGLAFGF
jgi:hypothetical protein